MNDVTRFVLKYRIMTLVLSFSAVLAFVPGLFRLQLRTDAASMVPDDSETIAEDRNVRDEFDIEDRVVIAIETKNRQGVFNAQTLGLIKTLTDAVTSLSEIASEDVVSLSTEADGWERPDEMGRYTPYVSGISLTDAEITEIRSRLFATEAFDGTLLSSDSQNAGVPEQWKPSATCVLVGVQRNSDRVAIVDKLVDVIADLDKGNDSIHLVGSPVAESLLGRQLIYDLAFIIPISLLVMSGVFWIAFRSLFAVLIPLAEVGAILVIIFGYTGYAGVPVYLTCTVIPVILTTIGVADEVHVFVAYLRLRRENPKRAASDVMVAAMADIGPAVIMTSLTTAVAFLGFLSASVPAVRTFGYLTAMGVLLLMLWSLTVVPAWLSYARDLGLRPTHTSARDLSLIVEWVLRHRRVSQSAVLLAVVIAVSFCTRLQVDDSWESAFSPACTFRQSAKRVDQLFHGAHILLVSCDVRSHVLSDEIVVCDPVEVAGSEEREAELRLPKIATHDLLAPGVVIVLRELHLEDALLTDRSKLVRTARKSPAITGTIVGISSDNRHTTLRLSIPPRDPVDVLSEPGPTRLLLLSEPLLNPEIVDDIASLEDYLIELMAEQHGGVMAGYDQLATTRFVFWRGENGSRFVPNTPDEIRGLVAMLEEVRGRTRREELFNHNLTGIVETLFVNGASYHRVRELMRKIDEYENTHLSKNRIHIKYGGDVAVNQTMIGSIVKNQINSLTISVAMVFAMSVLWRRSIHLGLAIVLPAILAIIVMFGLMGATGIPLGIVTSMFASITVGCGVDFGIHLCDRFLKASDKKPCDKMKAAVSNLDLVMKVCVWSICTGFSVLLLSANPVNKLLALFVLGSLIVSLLASLIAIPLLLSRSGTVQSRSGSSNS